MGKAQSKRSVDITTEVVAEEGTGRVEKIEDVDQLKPVAQVNGDTQHTEPENQKVVSEVAEGAENEKDLATEKNKPQTDAAPSAENADVVEKGVAVGGETVTTPSNGNGNGQEETLNESKVPAETTEAAPAPDSSKKSKKDKLKKKWSFRSISFGKKDKQKPVKKTEEKAEASKEGVATTTQVAADTNGECEKVPEEKIAEEQKIEETVAVPASSEVSVSDDAKNEVKPCLNGDSDKISQESEQKQAVVDENKVKETESVAVNGAASVKEEIKEPVVVPSVEKDEGIKVNGNVTEDESSKVEENGVSHAASTEESLNGGVEPTKTIEEMKAEHVDTNLSSEDQLPAVVSATE